MKQLGYFIVATCICLLIALGCQSDRPNGAMRFHNWWNYYERGNHQMASGDYDLAMSDFQKAIGQVPGARKTRAQDSWRARTYGMHFVEGYFPYREMGICHYRLGNYDEAIRYLEMSLEQEPSGRAKYFLNQSRMQGQRLVAKNYASSPIHLDIQGVDRKRNIFTKNKSYAVRGSANSPEYVSSISINAEELFIELAQTNIFFDTSVPLEEGTNTVRIMATDLRNHRETKELVVIADYRPPVFSATSITATNGGWQVRGAFSDEHGIQHAQLGHHTFHQTDSTFIEVNVRLAEGPIAVEAVDLAGNRLATTIDLAVWAQQSRATMPILLASTADAFPAGQSTPGDGDPLPPSLRLTPDVEVAIVQRNEYEMGIAAEDPGGLASLTIENEQQLLPRQIGERNVVTSRRLDLKPGTNNFTIVAMDRAGNTTSRKIQVIRQRPPYLEDKIRLSIGVVPARYINTNITATKITHLAVKELSYEPVRFRLLERDETTWESILTEQRIRLSDLVDERAAITIGKNKLMAADVLLITTLLKRDSGTEILARIVDTSEGRILCSADVYDEGDQNTERQLAGLIRKIEQHFPMTEGRLTRKNRTWKLNIGSRHGISLGHRFAVLESDDRIRSLGENTVEVVAVYVEDDEAIVRPFTSSFSDAIQTNDRVYTR